jgi:hypothetical protein
LALAGLGSALVAIWGLLGGPEISGSDSTPWIILGVTVAIGLTLIFSGGRGTSSKTVKPTTTSTER